jgi:hypothetical protein
MKAAAESDRAQAVTGLKANQERNETILNVKNPRS